MDLSLLSSGNFEQLTTSVFFNSFSESTNVWRIGSIADGSCFFHSLLTTIEPRYRKNFKNEEKAMLTKNTLVKEVREQLANKFSIDVWRSMQSGVPAKFLFEQRLRDTIHSVSKSTLTKKTKKKYPNLNILNNQEWIEMGKVF